MKRPAAAFCFSYFAAVVLGNFLPEKLVIALFAIFFIAFITTLILRKIKGLLLPVCLIGVATAFLVLFLNNYILYNPVMRLQNQEAQVTGKIVKVDSFTGKNYYYGISIKSIETSDIIFNGKSKIMVGIDHKIDAGIGDTVTFKSKLSRFGNTSNFFDLAQYYKSKGYYLRAFPTEIKIQKAAAKGILYYANKSYNHILSVLNIRLKGDAKALAAGIFLGEKSFFTDKLYIDIKIVGLSHAIAVSGMHLAFLVLFLSLILSYFKLPKKAIEIICIIAVLYFMAVISFVPSVVRSGIMVLIYFTARLFLKESEPINSLAISVFLITLINPYAGADIGLLLSFAATLGILLLSFDISEYFAKLKIKNRIINRIYFYFSNIFAATISACLFIFPVLILFIGGFSLISPISNLLLTIPILLIFVFSGLLSLLWFIPFLSDIFVWIINISSYIFVKTVSFLSIYDKAYINTRDINVIIIFTSVALLLSAYYIFRQKGAFKKVALCIAAILIVQFSSSISVIKAPPGTDALFASVNVGQGDCIAVIKNKNAVIVDCGSAGNNDAGTYALNFLNKNKVKKLNALIITHLHDDHANGAINLLQHYKPKKVYIPGYEIKTSVEKRFLDICSQYNVDIIKVNDDMTLELLKDINFSFYTKYINNFIKNEDYNDSSMMVKCDYKESEMLITGDITEKAEAYITNMYEPFNCDILKIPHHGSGNSTTGDFLHSINPGIAFISVGENDYGHPSQKTIAKLKDSKINYFRTDEQGDIVLSTSGNGIYSVMGGNKIGI